MPARRCALVSLKTLLCKAEKSQVGPSFLEKSACRDKAGTRRSYSLPCLHLYGPTFLTNQIKRLFCPRGAAFHRDQPARSPTIQSERQFISDRQSGRWRYLLPVATSLIDPLCSGGRGAVAESEVTVCLLAEQATSQY